MRKLDEILEELYAHPEYSAGVIITRDELLYHITETINWSLDMTITELDLDEILTESDWDELNGFVADRLDRCGDVIDIWPDINELEMSVGGGFLTRVKRELNLKKIL